MIKLTVRIENKFGKHTAEVSVETDDQGFEAVSYELASLCKAALIAAGYDHFDVFDDSDD